MPLGQLLNVVFTDQAVEDRVAFALANFFNSIDYVRRRRTQQLAFIHFELRLAFYRRPQHCQSYIAAGDRSGLLERRYRGRNKDDLLKAERLKRFASKNQMRVMDRIETAAINRDLLQSPNG